MENKDLYVLTQFEEGSAPDVPAGTDTSQMAQARLEATVRLFALGVRYVGSADGTFDEATRAEATTPNVIVANLTELLSAGNPDDAAAIQQVINRTSADELEAQLAEAFDDIEQQGLSRAQMLEEIEALGEAAEEDLNGFLPFNTQIPDDDELREHVAGIVDRFGFDVDMDQFDHDRNAFWEAFDEAQKITIGHSFNVLSGYLVMFHSMCAAKLAHPNQPFSDEQDKAVKEVADGYGLLMGQRFIGREVAVRRLNLLLKHLSVEVAKRSYVKAVFKRAAALLGFSG